MKATTCDTCGKKRPMTFSGGNWAGWLQVNSSDLEAYGGVGTWDFCSLDCLTSWATALMEGRT